MRDFILQNGAFVMAAAAIPVLAANMMLLPQAARDNDELKSRYRYFLIGLLGPQIPFFLLWGFCQLAGNHNDFIYLISSTEHFRPSVLIPRLYWVVYVGLFLFWLTAFGGAELISKLESDHPLMKTPVRVKITYVLLVVLLLAFLITLNASGKFVMT